MPLFFYPPGKEEILNAISEPPDQIFECIHFPAAVPKTIANEFFIFFPVDPA
jgi:hypothetical protein